MNNIFYKFLLLFSFIIHIIIIIYLITLLDKKIKFQNNENKELIIKLESKNSLSKLNNKKKIDNDFNSIKSEKNIDTISNILFKTNLYSNKQTVRFESENSITQNIQKNVKKFYFDYKSGINIESDSNDVIESKVEIQDYKGNKLTLKSGDLLELYNISFNENIYCVFDVIINNEGVLEKINNIESTINNIGVEKKVIDIISKWIFDVEESKNATIKVFFIYK